MPCHPIRVVNKPQNGQFERPCTCTWKSYIDGGGHRARARVLVKHAAGLNRRAALFRARVRAAPSPPAAVALADDFLNTLGAGMAAGRA